MASELFKAIDSLFNKTEPASLPSPWVVHRFLAWEPSLAPAAAELSRLKDDDMVWAVWRGALPRQAQGPRLGYPAPKRGEDAGDLVEAIATGSHLSRRDAEDAVDLAEMAGRTGELRTAYGLEPE